MTFTGEERIDLQRNMDIIETPVSRERVFDGLIIHVDRAMYRLPNGAVKPREIAVHPGASAVVAVDGEGMVTLVRQFRAALDRVTLEIPAGKLDAPVEDRLDAARRELSEETGLKAAKWTHLTDMASTPGFCSEVISIYLAEELSQGETHPDDDEFLNVIRMPLEEACKRVMDGEIGDSKTICGLLMARSVLAARV